MARPTWYKPDTGLTMRMLLTIVMLLALYAAFVFVLGAYTHNFLLFVLIAAVLAGAQFYFSDKIALWSMNARAVTPQEAPDLYAMVERLAQQANLPTPKIYIADTSIPNAFATGRNERNAVICVTTGILNRLTGPEMEAVLAHELTHIINHDILIMTVATFFAMVAQLILRWFYWFGFLFGMGGGDRRGRDDNSGYVAIIAFLASIVVAVVSFFLTRALSRYREYAADRGSALLTGSPGNLASALMKISDTMSNGRIPDRDLRDAEPASALMIAPLAVNGDDLAEAFSTHPSTRNRVKKLMEMQQQMESAPRIH